MSEILDKIRKDYIEFSKRNKYIQDLIAKFENGKASLSEIDSITKATGYALKVAITKNVSENAAAFADEDTLLEILDGTFHDNYELINEVAASVQKNLDKKQGINIKPQKADFPQDRIENLAKFTAGKDLSEEKDLSEFGASIENINNSIYTDYVQTNAKFRYEAGLRVYVIRTDGAGCCEWCSNLVGKYEEPNIPKDVWRRHKRCSCEITYVNEKTGARDRITYSDSKNGKKIESQKHVTKLTPEQAFAKEKEVLSRIDKTAESGIIKEEIDKGNIKLEINHEKQSRHIKGSPEYIDGRSYLTISEDKAQKIINEKSGTGLLVYDRNGLWKHKELIDCNEVIGVDINKSTMEETPTDKGTIHYSKSGTHLVPRKEKKHD